MTHGRLRIARLTLGIAVTALALAMPARAGDSAPPAAIVEDLKGKVGTLEAMDYLDAGQVLQLKAADVLIIGYLKSCVRETIRGGKVTVGAEQSQVDGGKVERARIACDGSKLRLTAEQAGKSGATVFRRKPSPGPSTPAQRMTIYSTSPAITGAGPGEILIERLDQPENPITVKMAGRKTDLAKAGIKLTPGATYRALMDGQIVLFTVDQRATAGAGPLAGRLIQF